MLDITFFDLRTTALYSIAESDSRDVVRSYSTSDRHFLVCTNSLDNKENPGLLRLRVHRVVVLLCCDYIRWSEGHNVKEKWTGCLYGRDTYESRYSLYK